MPSDFVNDLRTLREQKGLGLEDIHSATRIPIDVLKRFESGNLLSDPTYSDVYIRAFLKSYAEAVEKSPRRILVAYDAHKAGTYSGGLVDVRPELSSELPTGELEQDAGDEKSEQEPSGKKVKEEEPSEEESKGESSSPVEALSVSPEESEGTEAAREAPMVRTAQNFPRRTSQRKAPDRSATDTNWLPVFGTLAVLILILGGLIWYFFFYEPIERSEEPQEEAREEVVPSTETEEEAAVPELSIPIRITVTAGGDGLQNFRVTETPDQRLGHWIEVGESLAFESDSLVILWGEGANGLSGEATLELQGFRWAPSDGAVLRIDRERGQQLLDSLATETSTGS